MRRSARRGRECWLTRGSVFLMLVSSACWAQEAPSEKTAEQTSQQKPAAKKKSDFWRAPIATPKIELPNKVIKQLDGQIIPAIVSGDENAFLNAAMPLIQSAKPEILDAADQHCHMSGVPSVSDHFVDLVLQQAAQGVHPAKATDDLKMGKVIVARLIEKLGEFHQSAIDHLVMQDPLTVPDDFQASEVLFWNIHVLHNEFENAARDGKLARSILSQHAKSLRNTEDGDQLESKLNTIEEKLTAIYNTIQQRAAEMRLQRFMSVHGKLGPENDFETRLISTMALEQDGSVLVSYLKNAPVITRPALTEVGLTDKVVEMLKTGRETAGDVTIKANLFRNGLHYWVRGRYGSGPRVEGLVKSPNATQSKQVMEALYMPKVRDLPISDYHSDDERTPGYDRRHHYTWAAEYRPLVRSSASRSTSNMTFTGNVKNEGRKNKRLFL